MGIRFRAARRDELPSVYDVLDACFTDAPRSLFVAQTEQDSTFKLRHARVAVDDGRIIAYVRIFARTMLLRGVPVPAAGVGSVATAVDARGHGLASALMRDALDVMRRERFTVSFLFTGIPSFYERSGYGIMREPQVVADAHEALRLPRVSLYRTRPAGERDVSRMLAIYQRAIAGSSGSVVRTRRTWRDAQHWLGEREGDAMVAEHNGVVVAYIRTRCRGYGHEVIEAEQLPGHEQAVAALVADSGRRAAEHGERLVTTAPADHQLATLLRTLPSSSTTTDVRFPMMARIVSLEATFDALLPHLHDLARTHPGPPLRLRFETPDGDELTAEIGRRDDVAAAQPLAFDAAATLRVLFGQQEASPLAAPRPPDDVARRLDALFPKTPLHFWNSDRI